MAGSTSEPDVDASESAVCADGRREKGHITPLGAACSSMVCWRDIAAGEVAPAAGRTGTVKPARLNSDSSDASGSPKTAGEGRGTPSTASRKELGPEPLAPSKISAAVRPGREAPAAGRNRKGRFASSSDEEPRGVAMGRSLLTCL